VLTREKPDGSTTSYVYGTGLLYEVNDATGDTSYYHFDNIGSTAALTGSTGALTDRVEYDPYGAVTRHIGMTDTPFLYVGEWGVQLDVNGLLYMRARYYSVEMRRFINADPIDFRGGINWYAYADGDPVIYNDPSGLDVWVIDEGGHTSVTVTNPASPTGYTNYSYGPAKNPGFSAIWGVPALMQTNNNSAPQPNEFTVQIPQTPEQDAASNWKGDFFKRNPGTYSGCWNCSDVGRIIADLPMVTVSTPDNIMDAARKAASENRRLKR
jgi:RHS repeat-associated protein